jgi:hypothetical protein
MMVDVGEGLVEMAVSRWRQEERDVRRGSVLSASNKFRRSALQPHS